MQAMTPSERHLFTWILLAIAVVAVATNSLLIRLARRLQHQTPEIRLAVVLASVDMDIPTLAIGASLLSTWHDDGLASLQSVCQIKGPIDFLLQYASVLIVAVIAMERHAKVKGSIVPATAWTVICVYTTVYTTLVLMTAFRGEFFVSPSGCDCAPIAQASANSAVVVFGLGFAMAACLVITLFSYLSILGYARRAGSKASTKRNGVVVRVMGICFIYLLLIAPSSILIMMEGTYNSGVLDKLSLAISILVALIAVANPCMVLFAHSLIYEQLRHALASVWPPRTKLESCDISLHSRA